MMVQKDKLSKILNKQNQLPYQIAEYLAEKIIHMQIKPGERILEAKIAQELGVSRSPVREALHILNEKFLVELLPRRGAVVAGFSIKFIEDLYDILKVLYLLLSQKGVSKISDENFNQIAPFFQTMEECANREDFEGYYNAIFDFMEAAIKIVDNPILERLIMNLWPTKKRMMYATLFKRKHDLKSNLDFFLKSVAPYLEKRIDLVENNIVDYLEQEKENAILLAKEFELSNTTEK
ncbi:MAG TPA: GntR family transcriptional regulator [Smithella sp.]|nr:GntR family transcriptional regulator [Smithella sp.]